MNLAKLYLFLLSLLVLNASAQLDFTSLPSNLQMFVRDADNFGRFKVEGTCVFQGQLRSVLSKRSSGEVVENYTLQVEAGKPFSILHKIPAQLEEFDLLVFMRDTGSYERLVARVTNLVSGDFYIVAGQSNAESTGDESNRAYDSTYSHPCNRSIGANFSWANSRSDSTKVNYSIEEDCRFGRPSSYYYANGLTAFSGTWPIKLQFELATQTGIPNCFVNGALGGSSISQNMASHTPSLPDSLRCSAGINDAIKALPYDRIFKKIYENKVNRGVKGIFWYQGETDGNFTRDSAESYPAKFRKLYTSWKSDYPGLKKIFVLQINVGCSGAYLHLIREIQRRFPEEYEDVVTMSTVGSPAEDRRADICHYTQLGCARIASKLAPLAQKYIYNFYLSEYDFLPANILSAYYTQAHRIRIEFDKKIRIEQSCKYVLADTGVAYLKDYFYDENNVSLAIESVESEGNLVFLNLAPNKPHINKLTYLPLSFTRLPSVYGGPWILNENNPELGAYAFAEFPVGSETLNTAAVYPNPAKEFLEVFVMEPGPYTVAIQDCIGRPVLSKVSQTSHVVINTSNLGAGVYIVKVTHSKGITTKKIIVE